MFYKLRNACKIWPYIFDILAGPWALGLMGPSARFHGAALGQ